MDIVTRVKNILITPKTEWYEIDAEETSIASLYTSYVVPLAAIPVIAQLIGGFLTLMINGLFSVAGLIILLIGAAISYVIALVMTYVMALIVDKLAPTFEASPHMPSAFKLIAYSYTAAWVAGILGIVPISIFVIIGALLGLYSLYLIYTGLPVLMRAPQEKALVYTIAVVVIAVVLTFLFLLVVGLITAPIYLALR